LRASFRWQAHGPVHRGRQPSLRWLADSPREQHARPHPRLPRLARLSGWDTTVRYVSVISCCPGDVSRPVHPSRSSVPSTTNPIMTYASSLRIRLFGWDILESYSRTVMRLVFGTGV